MKRAISTPAPELTDWISCTTPPVRDGRYEIDIVGDVERGDAKLPSLYDEFVGGIWTKFDGINQWPRQFVWRGIRQWVLVRRDDPLCGCDVYVRRRSISITVFTGPERALAFSTKAKAEAYRDRGRPFGDFAGIEAVLP